MPFVQRIIEPKYLSRTSLFTEDGTPVVTENELVAVTNNTLSNALRQLASLVLVANDIFTELGIQFNESSKRAEKIKKRINLLEECISKFDPKKVAVREILAKAFTIRCCIFISVVGGSLKTIPFTYPHKKKSGIVRSGDLTGHMEGPFLPIHWLGKMPSRYALTSREKCAGVPSC
ncbi:unnamed protein product [Brassicogethes aeneus]|uniref:Uncharacterized protein n=1 Tax=Brassicogethes aeneus TaxID=1431903 RepID=A0A9P0AYB5_BRAAE|nr:unnamed protein product [Brassicogethes aeneus]